MAYRRRRYFRRRRREAEEGGTPDLIQIVFLVSLILALTFGTKSMKLPPGVATLLVVLCVGMVAIVGFNVWSQRRVREEAEETKKGYLSDTAFLQALQGLSPDGFERFVTELLGKLGYEATRTGGPNDGGVDVIAKRAGIEHYVQCKKFIVQQVSVGAMRDFYGAMVSRNAQGKGLFVTTNVFTTEAERFAEGKQIELIDGRGLVKLVKHAFGENLPALPTSEVRKCPNCGRHLVRKEGRYGGFLACPDYPTCRHTEPL